MGLVAVVSAVPLYAVPEPEPPRLTLEDTALIMEGLAALEAVADHITARRCARLADLLASHDLTFADVRPNTR